MKIKIVYTFQIWVVPFLPWTQTKTGSTLSLQFQIAYSNINEPIWAIINRTELTSTLYLIKSTTYLEQDLPWHVTDQNWWLVLLHELVPSLKEVMLVVRWGTVLWEGGVLNVGYYFHLCVLAVKQSTQMYY